ncbi:MAG: hypothetical protein KGJ44_11855, partial [Betaproteobacteria bacterium]|nr:hypothetical protein [Betaproteobacteria bacterium]
MDARRAQEREDAAARALREVDAALRADAARRAAPAGGVAAPPWPAPVIAVHGVGNFAMGDVVAEIASSPVFSDTRDFRRQTLFASTYRYTLLEDDAVDEDARVAPRFLEANWSDVRKPLSTLLGLLRNFVLVLLALLRIGVYGAYGSSTLGRPLRTPAALYVFEGVLVWAALLPMLSVLLWRMDVTTRFGVGLGVAAAACYVAWLMRNVSRPLAAGGEGFALLAALAGWLACNGVTRVQDEARDGSLSWQVAAQPGRELVAALCGAIHSWAVVAAGVVLTLAALEVLLVLRGDNGARPDLTQRFARIACLWLPVVLLVVVQPLTVSALLVTLDGAQQRAWGLAFEQGMAFHPRAGQFAGSLVALALLVGVLLGAVQYKLVDWRGRNGTMALCLLLGALMLGAAEFVDRSLSLNCRCCTRPDWLALGGLMLVLSGAVTYWLYRDHRVWFVPGGSMAWHPSGDCARLWAVCLLWGFPLVLMASLGILFWHVVHGVHALAGFVAHYGPCDAQPRDLHADQAFLQSTKYALLLVPLATKPFAALLDALGDVFYFVVKQPTLQSRDDTLPRLGRALQTLRHYASGQHLIVFAHSQGTAIAAALFDALASALRAGTGRITLLTVGAPVTSLYQRFLGV